MTVAGAVFYPGRHTIGGVKDSDKLAPALAKYGDNPTERFVAAGLRAAGGVRPDANIAAIRVVRGRKSYMLDWQGAITGAFQPPIADSTLNETRAP